MIKDQSGFSLVELAISVTVIGLLVGIAVKSGEMIENARISSSILQIKSFDASIDNFRTEYKAWPGDFDRATTFIEQCASITGCANGDGNGLTRIGTSNNPSAFASASADDEPLYVWKQLLAAGYGYGITTGSTAQYGSALPALSAVGGIEMYYDNDISEDSIDMISTGHFFRMAGNISAADLSAGEGIDGRLAFLLDVKIDNGNILNGGVVAAGITGACAAGDESDCVLFYQLGY